MDVGRGVDFLHIQWMLLIWRVLHADEGFFENFVADVLYYFDYGLAVRTVFYRRAVRNNECASLNLLIDYQNDWVIVAIVFYTIRHSPPQKRFVLRNIRTFLLQNAA